VSYRKTSKRLQPREARDLTRGWFAHLRQQHSFARAKRSKAKLRSFLLTALNDFLANERNHARTGKRAPTQSVLIADADAAKTGYSEKPRFGSVVGSADQKMSPSGQMAEPLSLGFRVSTTFVPLRASAWPSVKIRFPP
jgi:hypothetical protein